MKKMSDRRLWELINSPWAPGFEDVREALRDYATYRRCRHDSPYGIIAFILKLHKDHHRYCECGVCKDITDLMESEVSLAEMGYGWWFDEEEKKVRRG